MLCGRSASMLKARGVEVLDTFHNKLLFTDSISEAGRFIGFKKPAAALGRSLRNGLGGGRLKVLKI